MQKRNMHLRIFVGFLVMMTSGWVMSCQLNKPVQSVPESQGQITPLHGPFKSDSLVGYWKSRDDELITHITGLEHNSKGSGSFKDVEGRVYHAQKFQDIRYLGGNK